MQVEASSDAQQAPLFASRVVEQHQHVTDVAPVQESLDALNTRQHEFMEKQLTQNMIDKLVHIESLAQLELFLQARRRVDGEFHKRQSELEAAIAARNALMERITQQAGAVEQAKLKQAKLEGERGAFERELEKLRADLKEQQMRNSTRSALLQVSLGTMMSDEQDCRRVLDHQTHEIQDLHERQKRLEERKVDLTTQVNRATQRIRRAEKKKEVRRTNVAVQQRQEQRAALEHMQQWYQHMNDVVASVTGIEVLQTTSEFIEVRVLQSHVLRLHFDSETTRLQRVEFKQTDVDTANLAEEAIRANDAHGLLCEYRDRIFETQNAS